MRPFFVSVRLAVYTLGCRVNAYESACIEDRARARGFDVVAWDDGADIGVVNSCALTTLAEAKTRQIIRVFARKNPQSKIAITGCYAQTDPRALEMENVCWVVGNKQKASVVDIIADGLARESADAAPSAAEFASRPAELFNSGSAPLSDRMNIKIQDGCDNACAYCIIPRARGLPRSMDFGAIVADAENLVSRGVREIVLTGINISKFSTPQGGLIELIDRLAEIKNLLRLRLGSIEPPLLPLEAVLERAKDSSHILMPHLHISAQSLSDAVLQRMRRRYSSADFLKMVETCLNGCPDIAVGGDIICGHPAETREEFLTTKARLLSSGMAYVHVFTYSPRPKTLAATMKDIPDARERKARADELREEVAILKADFAKKLVGRPRKVLLENMISDGVYFAHTDNYVPAKVPLAKSGMKNTLLEVEVIGVDSSLTLKTRGVKTREGA